MSVRLRFAGYLSRTKHVESVLQYVKTGFRIPPAPQIIDNQYFMELHEIIQKLHSIKDDYMETPGMSVLDIYHRHYPITIKEGLIKTYPTESVLVVMTQLFDLSGAGFGYGKNGSISLKRVSSGLEDISSDILIICLKKESAYLVDQINNHMLKYGWFLASDENDDGEVKLRYEKKFGDRYSAFDLTKRGRDKFLYHITSSKNAKKIKEQGFIPKSKTEYLISDKKFKVQPEESNRVYFFVEKPPKIAIDTWGSVAVSRTGGEPVLITVNPEYIDNKVSFFADPRWQKGVFTYEPISPSAIVSIEKPED